MEMGDRLLIIKQASLSDASILAMNYSLLIQAADNTEEREQFIVLRINSRNRIEELGTL